MESISKIFDELKSNPLSNSHGFHVRSISYSKGHKLGVTSDRQPMFFIKCGDSDEIKTIDYSLEFISVQFNRECVLQNDSQQSESGTYSIISLKTDLKEIQEYFLEIVLIIIEKLPAAPKTSELRIEIEKLINLFSQFSRPPIKSIQGLWAELLVIEQSKNPDYLIKSWHSLNTDKFDFNDGNDKIEVKSTSKNRRIHSFSIEQLNPNENSILIVVSIFTIETGIGLSIFELEKRIRDKVGDRELIFKVNEIIAKTLGSDFQKSFDTFFDYQFAIDTIKYFSSDVIPKIDLNSVPSFVANVRFDSDLTDLIGLSNNPHNSSLHNAIFQ